MLLTLPNIFSLLVLGFHYFYPLILQCFFFCLEHYHWLKNATLHKSSQQIKSKYVTFAPLHRSMCVFKGRWEWSGWGGGERMEGVGGDNNSEYEETFNCKSFTPTATSDTLRGGCDITFIKRNLTGSAGGNSSRPAPLGVQVWAEVAPGGQTGNSLQ